ncbi:hypothetical protein M501DRAFT_987076 [Patellaria atrata CBS 101060]|uniref:Uncharacterized protein n=1 Tax=Patellaria atrata CBS 101060 TaxID=1346257 RepID=A0A9P4S6E3_9PEZI|nr:hypothetical protein M501DRAFT_987076 [Patellaria atrata CBS 101060]
MGVSPSNRPELRLSMPASSSSSGIPVPEFTSSSNLRPKDSHTFSFDPQHLADWTMPATQWNLLPVSLQKSVTAIQQAGAAVDTGFMRLEELKQVISGTDGLDEGESDFDNSFPITTRPRLLSLTKSLSTSSNVTAGSPTSSSFSQYSPVITPMTPSTPMTPPILSFRAIPTRETIVHVLPPPTPQHSYYAAELAHLRTEALPRLRHAIIRLETEWYEQKEEIDPQIGEDLVRKLREWIGTKKADAQEMHEMAKMLGLQWKALELNGYEDAGDAEELDGLTIE